MWASIMHLCRLDSEVSYARLENAFVRSNTEMIARKLSHWMAPDQKKNPHMIPNRANEKTLRARLFCVWHCGNGNHVPRLLHFFFVEDRVESYPTNQGFSAELQKELGTIGLEEISWSLGKNLTAQPLDHFQEADESRMWAEMMVARSTRFLCVTFGDSNPRHRFVSLAASHSLTVLRIVLVTWTGSVGIAISKRKVQFCPFCRARLDGKHDFMCGENPGFQLTLTSYARNSDFKSVLRHNFSVYFRFLFRLRPSVLSQEEANIFDSIVTG